MTLRRSSLSDIPSDAVKISEDDARKYQAKILHKWKDSGDVFAFRYGGAILASANAAVGMYINNYYRRKFKLFRYGQISSYLPIVFFPATISFLFHTQFVVGDILLPHACVVCAEIRGSAIQAFSGSVLPTILGPLAAISLAIQYNTYDVPYITQEPMKVFRLLQKQSRPIANILMAIFLGQALLGSLVTYFEIKSVHTVNSKLDKIIYELEHSG